MTVLQGTMQDGTVLPVQVDAQGRLVAVGPFLERLDSNRNVLINGNLRINQRGVTIAAAAVGQYGPDRWKKVDASHMTQIVEDLNVVHGATYTLSGTGVTTQQLTAPASGHWTLPNIPITATNIQLELGTVATPFEHRSYGQELSLCQRYYQVLTSLRLVGYTITNNELAWPVNYVPMRANPTGISTGFSLTNVASGAQPVPVNMSATGGALRILSGGGGVTGAIDGTLTLSAEL
jgi:hypothetical protein